MRAEALKGKKSLVVRRVVEEVCAGLAEGDYAGELLAIYYWVTQNIRYMRDIDNVELLKSPDNLLKTRSGDCDDIATLLAAMFMAAGNPVQFAIVAFNNSMRPAYSHVFVEAITPHGPVLFDPVANRIQGEMVSNIKAKKTFPVSGGPGVHDAGIGSLGFAGAVSPVGKTVYSVFDFRTGNYNYYESGEKLLPPTGRMRAPAKRAQFGIVPEWIAAPLPPLATKTGSGPLPKGVIATRQGVIGALRMPESDTWAKLLLGAGLGVFAYTKWWRKKR
jgi:hypothetical protein